MAGNIDEILEVYRQRKAAYQLAFGGAHGPRVLEDLKIFCCAERSYFDVDPRLHAFLEGRRQVYLRIQEHLCHDPEKLYELYRAVIGEAEYQHHYKAPDGEQEDA